MHNIDDFEINDSTGPKGFVIIKDAKTGRILIKKHNMIVKTGKEFLLNFLLKNSCASDDLGITDLKDYDGYRLSNYAFGTGTAETTYDFDIDDFNNGDINTLNYKELVTVGTNSNGNTENMKFIQDNDSSDSPVLSNHPYLKFTFSEVGDNSLDDVSELGLFLTKQDIENDIVDYKLFSRIVFDPIPYGANNEFKVSYYIYF